MSSDLHCHTRLSDGSLGIEEMIALAKAKKIETIAITDHDCLAGTVRAKIIGERNGIKVLPGVELSAIDEETGEIVHVLCYLPDYPDRLEGLCHKNNAARKRASQYMMIKAAGRYPVTADIMKRCAAGSTNLYKQHIMHALMEVGVVNSIYDKLYDELFNENNPNTILVKPAFAPLKEVLQAIHDSLGVAVLAHPALHNGMQQLSRLVLLGFDGIEVWHPTADAKTVEILTQFAKKNKLLMTGGSDFHGMYNVTPVSLGDYQTPKAQLQELISFKAKLKRQSKKEGKE